MHQLDLLKLEHLRTLPPSDYYEVLSAEGRGKKVRHRFLCHALARDPEHALSIAKAHGLSINRQSIAHRIGLDTYGRRVQASLK